MIISQNSFSSWKIILRLENYTSQTGILLFKKRDIILILTDTHITEDSLK